MFIKLIFLKNEKFITLLVLLNLNLYYQIITYTVNYLKII